MSITVKKLVGKLVDARKREYLQLNEASSEQNSTDFNKKSWKSLFKKVYIRKAPMGSNHFMEFCMIWAFFLDAWWIHMNTQVSKTIQPLLVVLLVQPQPAPTSLSEALWTSRNGIHFTMICRMIWPTTVPQMRCGEPNPSWNLQNSTPGMIMAGMITHEKTTETADVFVPSGELTKSYWKWPSRNSGFSHS